MSQNPFIVGKAVPPERFVGRESEIAAAFDQIFSRSHLAIWGGPGMGKTSFLQKLESPQAWKDYGMDSSQGVIVRFSCESIVPFTSPNFWGEILNLLKEKLEGESTLEAEEAPQAINFAQEAEKQWGGGVSWRTATSYDATQAFIQALSDNPNRTTILENLEKVNVPINKTSGYPLKFSPEGERETQPVLVQIKGGKFVAIPQ